MDRLEKLEKYYKCLEEFYEFADYLRRKRIKEAEDKFKSLKESSCLEELSPHFDRISFDTWLKMKDLEEEIELIRLGVRK
jgi:hypothetical protein